MLHSPNEGDEEWEKVKEKEEALPCQRGYPRTRLFVLPKEGVVIVMCGGEYC